jgi:hypothetical protein
VQGILLLVVAIGLTAIMYLNWPALAVIGVLLPTLIHVSAFTLVFMGLRAWRARSAAQGSRIVAYLAGIAVILAMRPLATTVIPQFGLVAQDYFRTAVAMAAGG